MTVRNYSKSDGEQGSNPYQSTEHTLTQLINVELICRVGMSLSWRIGEKAGQYGDRAQSRENRCSSFAQSIGRSPERLSPVLSTVT
jgi:hypothetical protein